MKETDVGDLRIAYRMQGAGPPLVLLHGALSDSRAWRNQLEALSDDYTVVAWDAPGCGRSSDPPETFSLSDYADALAGLIGILGLERPHLLGLSFGGGLALEFYRRYPDVPRSLVLASAYAGWAGSLSPEDVEGRLQNGLRQSGWPPERVVEKWIPTLFSESPPERAVAETAEVMADFHPAGMRAMLRAFAAADLRGTLPEIGVPTLLLYGEADRRSPLPVAREMHAAIPGSELVVMEGVGHVGNVEAPEKFNSAVRGFLSANGQ